MPDQPENDEPQGLNPTPQHVGHRLGPGPASPEAVDPSVKDSTQAARGDDPTVHTDVLACPVGRSQGHQVPLPAARVIHVESEGHCIPRTPDLSGAGLHGLRSNGMVVQTSWSPAMGVPSAPNASPLSSTSLNQSSRGWKILTVEASTKIRIDTWSVVVRPCSRSSTLAVILSLPRDRVLRAKGPGPVPMGPPRPGRWTRR